MTTRTNEQPLGLSPFLKLAVGYVKVAWDPTSFEIQAFSTSPPASLFELPPGATVTTVTTPTS